MSEQQPQQESPQLGLRQVDLTKKSNLLIPQAHKVADNLHAKIYVDSVWASTFGKAYLIDQHALSSELTMSTVLQETKDGQLVTMETVHPSNEDVSKQFERKRRTTKDYGITMYPMWVALALLSVLYTVLIYKTAVKKEPIIIESSQWFDIFLVTVIFIIIEGWIYYWIATQYIETTTFRSYTRAKTKSYEIRFDGKLESITAVKFHGMFFSLGTTTSKKLFGHSPGEIEEYLKDDNGISYVRKLTDLFSRKVIIEQQLVDAYRIYETKRYELENAEAEFVREKMSNGNDLENLTEIEKQKEKDTTIQEKHEEVKKSKNHFDELDEDLTPKRTEIIKDIAALEEDYLQAINDIMGDAKDKKARELLTNSEKVISNLTHEKSLLKAANIRLTNMLQGAYEEGLIRSDQVRENVYALVQEEGAKKYEISYTIAGQNGNETQTGRTQQPQQQQKNSGVSLDLTPVLKILFGVGAIIAIIYALGWLFSTVIDMFGGLTPLAVLGMFLFLLIIIVAGMFIFRGLAKYDEMMTNSQSSIKLN